MHRYCTTALMAIVACGFIWIAPARADDTADMHEEIAKLKSELDSLSRQDAAELDSAIETYLDESNSFRGAQGEDRWKSITMGAAITAVSQNTVALDPGNRVTPRPPQADADQQPHAAEQLIHRVATLRGRADDRLIPEVARQQELNHKFGQPGVLSNQKAGRDARTRTVACFPCLSVSGTFQSWGVPLFFLFK